MMNISCGSMWYRVERQHVDITFLEFQYMMGDDSLETPSWFEITILNFYIGVYW